MAVTRFLTILVLTTSLVACGGPDTEQLDSEMDSYWNEMSQEDKDDLCNAYLLFGPTDLEEMMKSNLSGFAAEQGLSEEEANLRISKIIDKAGEECL